MMHYIYSVASPKSEASIDERLENELETNRRNDEEEMRLERLHYQLQLGHLADALIQSDLHWLINTH